MNIKTATKKELRQADIDAVRKKADFEIFEKRLKATQEKQLEGYKMILKELDLHMKKATAIYSRILNNGKLWEADKKYAESSLSNAFLVCNEIQESRMDCQNQIMQKIMQINK